MGKYFAVFSLSIAVLMLIFVAARKESRTSFEPSALSSTSAAPSVAVHATSTPPQTPAPKLLWGAYVGDEVADLPQFEAQVGKSVDMRAFFVGFGDDFPLAIATSLKPEGKTLVLFWEPYQGYSDILSGGEDAYMTSFAATAASYGGPVIMVPFEEMNGNWYPWAGNPQTFVATYRYVHGFFRSAPNVKFGWAINSDSVPGTPANAFSLYYPGDSFVDYVGVDGFNFDDPWQSFSDVFAPALTALSGYDKPIIIFSLASAQGPAKAAWITDAFTVQIPKYPRIAGWIWFNVDKEKDWRVWSDPASLSAFKAILP